MNLDGDTGPENALPVTRADLHLHSRYSSKSDLWLLRQANMAESTTEPEDAYHAARARGMDWVTLTDHNTIEGALRLAGRDDFFISEEITTFFPDEDVKVHVLALGITEEQHKGFAPLRRNLYELVEYLNHEDILYVLAHPLTRLSSDLTRSHIERLMLLFPIWEVHNGSTLATENSFARRLASQVTQAGLEELADRHGIEPVTGGGISFTGGSDDHTGFDIASAFTITAPTASVADFLAEVRAGRTTTSGGQGSTLKLAHAMLALLSHEISKDGGEGSNAATRAPGVLGLGLFGLGGKESRKWMNLVSMAVGSRDSGMLRTLMSDRDLRRALKPLLSGSMRREQNSDEFHGKLYALVNATWAAGMRSALAGLSGINLANFMMHLDRLGRMMALQVLLLPHVLAANYHSRQRHFLKRLGKEMEPDTHDRTAAVPRVAMFTDTYGEVNGVTSILRHLAKHSQNRELPLDIIACGDPGDRSDGFKRFGPVASLHLPEYGQMTLSVPSLLDIIQHCEEKGYEVIHAATPGPMGLAAFMVSRILHVPLVGSYHTDVPRCVGHLTDDKLNEEIAWTYARWFYGRCDLTFVPSVFTSRDLMRHGFDQQKMAVLYQGVDADRFSPALRSQLWRQRLGGDDRHILLFVGRLSAEKDLRFLADCYLEMAARRRDVHLAIVGDGPMRAELEEVLGARATFTGWLEGDDLAAAYASADLFVFPSSVDTSGQVVLEAQASGLPVVLCKGSGASENIEPEVSGLEAPRRDSEAFATQIGLLLYDPERRQEMAARARQLAAGRSWDRIFGDLVDTYIELVNWWQPLSAASLTEDTSRSRPPALSRLQPQARDSAVEVG